MNEQYYIDKIKKRIAQKLNRGDSNTWRQREFEYLNEKVYITSKTNISVSTLKRIWNNSYKETPHLNTLNALAFYAGYEDWNRFKNSILGEEETDEREPKLRKYPWSNIPKLAYYSISFIALVIVLISFINKQPELPIVMDSSEVVFRYKKTSKGVPNTVVFNYDISMLNFDSAFIEQDWDKRRRKAIRKENKVHTSIYYYPGYFTAKLIVNNTVVKKENIHIETDGWQTIVSYKYMDLVPFLINHESDKSNSLYISPGTLKANNVDITKQSYWVNYYYSSDFGSLQCNNFVLNARIKNKVEEGGLTCQLYQIIVKCESGMISVPFAHNGCESNLKLHLLGDKIDGKENDLSAFGCDMESWNSIKLKSTDGILYIYLNNTKIYEYQLPKDGGKVYAVNFKSKGNGTLDDVKLYNNQGDVFLEEGF